MIFNLTFEIIEELAAPLRGDFIEKSLKRRGGEGELSDVDKFSEIYQNSAKLWYEINIKLS